MSEKRDFTGEELQLAKDLHLQGHSWKKVGKELRCSSDTIRKRADPNWAVTYAERRKRMQLRRTKRYQRLMFGRDYQVEEPGKEVFQKPLTQQWIPRTPNEYWLGDPPPGRSALDRIISIEPPRQTPSAMVGSHH